MLQGLQVPTELSVGVRIAMSNVHSITVIFITLFLLSNFMVKVRANRYPPFFLFRDPL